LTGIGETTRCNKISRQAANCGISESVISAEAEVHPAGAGDHGKTGSESAIAGVALGNEPKAACRTLSSAAQPEVIGHGAGINADFTLGHDLEIVPDIALAANDLTSLVINEPHLASQRRAS
jgi:hypothetical protein